MKPICPPSHLTAVSPTCSCNSTNVGLAQHRSFPASEGGRSPTSFLHSPSFLQTVGAVTTSPVHVQKVPQALYTSARPSCRQLVMSAGLSACDVCCAYWSVCLSIPSHCSMARPSCRQPVMCAGLSACLSPLTAAWPCCRQPVMSAVSAGLSACLSPLTVAWPCCRQPVMCAGLSACLSPLTVAWPGQAVDSL